MIAASLSYISSVQLLSWVRLFATPWIAAPGLPGHHQHPEPAQTHVHRVSDAIQPSVVPFSSCPQSLPASESFPMSQLFAWGGQSTGVLVSASVQLSHPYMTTGKTIALTRRTFFDKVMSLLFNMLSRLVIAFLPRSKRLLISWLQSPSAVILEPRKNSQPLFPHLFPMKWWDQMP